MFAVNIAAVTQASDDRGYHHGDLRETLLADAWASIAEHGVERLSMRALARRAGVSPTAPYRHFPSRRCLLAALMTRGFLRLRRVVKTARDGAGADPNERLLAAGMGYLSFAQENPTTYKLMFSDVIDDFSDYADLQQASVSAYAVVLGILEEVLARPGAPALELSQAGGVVWAGVHGLATLMLLKPDPATPSVELVPLQSVALLRHDPEAALRLLMHGITGNR